jgi:hypothetical protein
VGSERLAFFGSQPGRERSIETPATGTGARPRLCLATDSEVGKLYPGPDGGGGA